MQLFFLIHFWQERLCNNKKKKINISVWVAKAPQAGTIGIVTAVHISGYPVFCEG